MATSSRQRTDCLVTMDQRISRPGEVRLLLIIRHQGQDLFLQTTSRTSHDTLLQLSKVWNGTEPLNRRPANLCPQLFSHRMISSDPGVTIIVIINSKTTTGGHMICNPDHLLITTTATLGQHQSHRQASLADRRSNSSRTIPPHCSRVESLSMTRMFSPATIINNKVLTINHSRKVSTTLARK